MRFSPGVAATTCGIMLTAMPIGGNTAGNFGLDRHVDFGFAVDVDVIAGVLVFQAGVDLLRVDQADHFLVAAIADADMGAAGDHARLDLDMRGFAVHFADDRLAALLDAIDAQAERIADHVNGFGETRHARRWSRLRRRP